MRGTHSKAGRSSSGTRRLSRPKLSRPLTRYRRARQGTRSLPTTSAASPFIERKLHVVCCHHCHHDFELFSASWCECSQSKTSQQPSSKRCPKCERCACSHQGYENAQLWTKAPRAFVAHGFERLFIAYI